MQTKILAGAILALGLHSHCALDQINSSENPHQREIDGAVLSLVDELIHPNPYRGGDLNWVEPAAFKNNPNPVFTQLPLKIKWTRHRSDPTSQVEIFCNQLRIFYQSSVEGDLYLMDGITYNRHLAQPLINLESGDRIAIVPGQAQCLIKIFEANQRREIKADFKIEQKDF